MVDAAEALGGAVTGGLVAAAIDPPGKDLGGHELAACQNCGAALVGPYCHRCGQSGHVHRTLGHVAEEFAHGILHVDGKGWQTLPLLVFNPGRLTREYSHGRRRRYIAPLALYLFMVFMAFLVFGLSGSHLVQNDLLSQSPAAMLSAELDKARAEAARLAADRSVAPADRTAAASRVRELEADLAEAQAGAAKLHTDPDKSVAEQIADGVESGALKITTDDRALDARIKHAVRNFDFTLYKIQQKAYKFSFLLVPLSLPFMWLLFAGRRDVTLYDHTVFILYSLSFMLLLLSALVLLSAVDAPGGTVALLAVLAPPAHIFAQLRGAYQLSTSGALWRTALLLCGCVLILGGWIALIVALGFAD